MSSSPEEELLDESGEPLSSSIVLILFGFTLLRVAFGRHSRELLLYTLQHGFLRQLAFFVGLGHLSEGFWGQECIIVYWEDV